MGKETQLLIVRYLKDEDMCIHDLGKMLNMNPESLRYPIKILIEKKLIKQVGWKRPKSSGKPLKLYSSIMCKKNAEEYKRLTGAEKNKRYEEKFKALLRLKRLKKDSELRNRKQKKVDTNLFFL